MESKIGIWEKQQKNWYLQMRIFSGKIVKPQRIRPEKNHLIRVR